MDFNKHINELKTKVNLKNTLDINDIVIIIMPDIGMFGVVTDIQRDMLKKREWWHVSFTMLTIPTQQQTWTLRTEQMTGMEDFIMNDVPIYFSAVDMKKEEPVTLDHKEGKVIPFQKKKNV